MMTLKSITGVIALLTALCSMPADAQEQLLSVTTEQSTEALTASNQGTIVFKSNAVVQAPPDYSAVWLDGRVSFVGGEISTSERQLAFVHANTIPLMYTLSDYWRNVETGHFVTLQHPALVVSARRPHVLPSTAHFMYRIAEQYNASGCGKLRVNDATRLVSERPRNGSPYSVHPAGMALDLRVIDLNETCYAVFEGLLRDAEASGQADVTREYFPPHFHVVVVPELQPRRILLEARHEPSEENSGQSN